MDNCHSSAEPQERLALPPCPSLRSRRFVTALAVLGALTGLVMAVVVACVASHAIEQLPAALAALAAPLATIAAFGSVHSHATNRHDAEVRRAMEKPNAADA